MKLRTQNENTSQDTNVASATLELSEQELESVVGGCEEHKIEPCHFGHRWHEHHCHHPRRHAWHPFYGPKW